MRVWQDLIDLYVKGGLEVVTPEDDGLESGSSPFIRTLILLDADVLTWVEPGTTDEELWRHHEQRLARKVRSLRIFRWWVKYGLIVLLFGVYTLYNAYASALVPLIVSTVLGLVSAYLIRLGVSAAVRLVIQRQMERYLQPLLNP